MAVLSVAEILSRDLDLLCWRIALRYISAGVFYIVITYRCVYIGDRPPSR
jgi:hypothetical protein